MGTRTRNFLRNFVECLAPRDQQNELLSFHSKQHLTDDNEQRATKVDQ